jgi:nitrile hydratase
MMGFGSIGIEPNEPLFHAPWEKRAFGITLAMGASGTWNIDMSRHARESLPPAEYLASSYYEIWTKGVEKLVVQTGLVTPAELEQGRSLAAPAPIKRVLKAEDVPAVLARGGPADRPAAQPARFAVGDRVVTRNLNPRGHTRLPRYARSKAGVIERVHGAHVFPDVHAHGPSEDPQWLYTVRFTGRELWGDEADPTLMVSVDAWESYLEPA